MKSFSHFTWWLKNMPKKLDAENEILTLLLSAKYGYSVSKIATKLGYSRTTTSKYLDILEKNSKVFVQDVGQYKLWHHVEGYYKKNEKSSLTSLFFQPFYKLLMKHLPNYNINLDQIQELGYKISKDLDLSELAEEYIELSTSTKDYISIDEYAVIAAVNMEIINFLFSGIDDFNWAEPLYFQKEKFFIIRMTNSNFIEIPAHYYILCGILHSQIQNYADISVMIHNINEKKNIVDIKFQFNK